MPSLGLNCFSLVTVDQRTLCNVPSCSDRHWIHSCAPGAPSTLAWIYQLTWHLHMAGQFPFTGKW